MTRTMEQTIPALKLNPAALCPYLDCWQCFHTVGGLQRHAEKKHGWKPKKKRRPAR
jgi:hypothetical protein